MGLPLAFGDDADAGALGIRFSNAAIACRASAICWRKTPTTGRVEPSGRYHAADACELSSRAERSQKATLTIYEGNWRLAIIVIISVLQKACLLSSTGGKLASSASPGRAPPAIISRGCGVPSRAVITS